MDSTSLTTNKKAKLVFHSALFPNDPKIRYVEQGTYLANALSSFGFKKSSYQHIRVRVLGSTIKEEDYSKFRLFSYAPVSVLVIPADIDNTALRTMVTLLSFAGGIGASNAMGLSGPAGWIVRTSGLLLGMWLSTFIPVPSEEEDRGGSLNSIQNAINQNGVFPKVFGRIRYAPPSVAIPITSVDPSNQYVTVLLVLGFKPLHIAINEIKIGDIPISRISGIEHELYDGYLHFQNITLYNNQYAQLTPGFQLKHARSWFEPRGVGTGDDATLHHNVFEFNTSPDTMAIEIDFEFPEGLGNYSSDQFSGYNVDLQIRYKLKGSSGDWTNAIPAWSDDYLNREFTTLTETKAFEYLVKAQEALEDIIDILEPINFASHVVSTSLLNWLTAKSAALAILVEENLQDNEGLLTVDQIAILEDVQATVARFYNVATRIYNTSDDLLVQLSPLNQTLSGIINLLEVLDVVQQVYTYIKLGYGPELSTFPVWARWLIQFQNNTALFGEAPDGAFKIVNSTETPGAFYSSVKHYVPTGEYTVQIRRISLDQDNNSEIRDKVFVNAVRSVINKYQSVPPIRKEVRQKLALLAIRVRASDQITGTLDKITVLAKSPLQWHNGVSWQPYTLLDTDGRPVYKNLAWICCDIIRKYPNPAPADDANIDIEAWIDFAEYSDDNGLYFSGVITDEMSVQQALEMVCAIGKATPIMRDGKYSVVIDRPQATNVDLVTLSNANNFNGSKKMEEPPDALAIPFKNPDNDWADDKFIVYNDGYGPDTTSSTKYAGFYTARSTTVIKLTNVDAISVISVYDRITTTYLDVNDFTIQYVVGGTYTNLIKTGTDLGLEFLRYRVTLNIFTKVPRVVQDVPLRGIIDTQNPDSDEHTRICFKLGRYIIAANKLRPEAVELTIGLRNLRIERGDRLDIQMDISLIGIQSGRLFNNPIESMGDIVSFKLDTTVPMLAGVEYGISVINSVGETYTFPIEPVIADGHYNEVTLVTPTAQSATPIAKGDGFAFGQLDYVTAQMIVKEVQQLTSDLKAKLILVAHAPEIHMSDEDIIPPYDPDISNLPDPTAVRPNPPSLINIITDERALLKSANGLLTPSIQATIAPSITIGTQTASIAVDSYEVQYRLTGFSNPDSFLPISEQANPPQDRALHKMEFNNKAKNQIVWIDAGTYNRSANKVTITPVTELAFYSVRIRAISYSGLASDWNEEQLILVVGKTSPPPDVLNLRYSNGLLKWDYTAPIDFAGFKLKFTAGGLGSWESASSLNEGLVTANSFELGDSDFGDKTIFIKAFDINGNESVTAAKLRLNIGVQSRDIELLRSVAIGNLFNPGSFVGTLTNMTYFNDSAGTRIESNLGSKNTFYTRKGGPFYRKSGDSFDEFYQTNYPRVAAEVRMIFGADNYDPYWAIVNAKPQIHLDVIAEHDGIDIEIEHKTDAVHFWPAGFRPSPDYLPEVVDGQLWPSPIAGNDLWKPFNVWKAVSGKVDFPRFQIDADGPISSHWFRIVGQASAFKLTATKMDIVITVKAKFETISNVEFTDTVTGTLIPYQTSFDKIVSVIVDIIPDAATPYNEAITYRVFLGGPGPQLSPKVMFYDATDTAVPGMANITLIGY